MYLGISYFTQHTDVIEVMGSEDATTCHVAVLRHTGMYGQNHVGLYHRYTWEILEPAPLVLSVKINTHDTLHGAQRSWMHFVCACFHVCGRQNPNTPI